MSIETYELGADVAFAMDEENSSNGEQVVSARATKAHAERLARQYPSL